MINVELLTKRYGSREAVSEVSFSVAKGEVVGFLGPNGAGKTTTLRMITGFLKPTSGSIRVGGVDSAVDPLRIRKQIGYMPEGVPLYPEMRVAEYLLHRAELKGIPRRHRLDAMDRSLEQAGVVEAADRIIGQLSKGFRQRVGLADALIADPPLLILDEPTAGLDPNQIRDVRALIRGFAGEKTVFLSTHILPEVEATCQRVVIINRGRKVGEGRPDELRATLSGQGHRTLLLHGRGEEDAFREVLLAVEGVVAIESSAALDDTGLIELVVRTETGGSIPEDVFRSVAAAGLTLRRLAPQSASLEEVFAGLTTVDHAAHDVGRRADDGEPDGGEEDGGEEDDEADSESDEQDDGVASADGAESGASERTDVGSASDEEERR